MLRFEKSFRKLIAWQKAKDLTLLIYQITKTFPNEEKFALTSQLKRAAYSVMANIAEGNTKNHEKD